MPIRKEPFTSNDYYHVYNRTYLHEPFVDRLLSKRAIFSLWYTNYPHMRSVSRYISSSVEYQQGYVKSIQGYPPKISIIAFVLMPNHFHLLVKQNLDNGISKVVSDFQNTTTQYFNKKYKCRGPLFERQFKAVLIKSGEQLVHVSRYIHLNPHTAHLTNNIQDLVNFSTSSFGIYQNKRIDEHRIIDTTPILSMFRNQDDYLNFVMNHAEHQRTSHDMYRQYIDI